MNVYEEVEAFYQGFCGEKRIIGKSEEGRNLYAMFLGKREFPIGISQAAIHGREWITALFSLSLMEKAPKRGGFWVVPLTNPDGALLSEVGLSSVKNAEDILSFHGGSDFSLWKANARGVDLNVNFDARWGEGEKNVRFPASENYVGEFPLCAAESAALAAFTDEIIPDLTVSWHTKGEEIYWKFHQPLLRRRRDRNLARILSRAVGCPLKDCGNSVGGYKDWCVQSRKIPAFTVEMGAEEESHPLGRELLPQMKLKYGSALCALAEGYQKIYGRKVHARSD